MIDEDRDRDFDDDDDDDDDDNGKRYSRAIGREPGFCLAVFDRE